MELADVIKDPKFQALSEGAKAKVVKSITAKDPKFLALSEGTRVKVLNQAIGGAAPESPEDNSYDSSEYEGSPAMKQLAGIDKFKKVEPAPEPTAWEKVRAIPETAWTLGAGAAGAVAGQAAGAYKAVTGGKQGTPEGVAEAEQTAEDVGGRVSEALGPDGLSPAAQSNVRSLAEAFDTSKLAGLPGAQEEAGAVGSALKAAKPQIAGALAPEAALVKAAVKKVTPNLPKISPEKADLAAKAQAMGIELSPHVLSDSKSAKVVGDLLENIPASGSAKKRNFIAFQRFLSKQIGGDEGIEALTPQVVAKAQNASGKTIGKIMESADVPLDAVKPAMGAFRKGLKKETASTRDSLSAYLDEFEETANENGGIVPGTALRKIDSEVGRHMRRTTDGDLKGALSDYQSLLRDAAETRIGDPEIIKTLRDARMKYAKSKTLEPLVAKNQLSGVHPHELLSRESSNAEGKHRMATGAAGELGDAAAIAKEFMGKPPNIKRDLVTGAALETGAAIAGGLPGTVAMAGAGYAMANLYNRFGARIARRIVENSKSKPKAGATKPELGFAEESPFKPKPAAPAPDMTNPTHSLAPAGSTIPSSRPSGAPSVTSIPERNWDIENKPIVTAPEPADKLSLTHPEGIDPYAKAAPATPVTRGLLSTSGKENPEPLSAKKPPLVSAEEHVPHDLRQEYLDTPEMKAVTQAYMQESENLKRIIKNAINPKVKEKAQKELEQLERDFEHGMGYVGARDAGEAHGARVPLYEGGTPAAGPLQPGQTRGWEPTPTRLPIKKTQTFSMGDAQ